MRKVIIAEDNETVSLHCVDHGQPIFAKREGKLLGMLVNEDNGWILRIGGPTGSNGHHKTLKRCMQSLSSNYGYEFFVE